MIQNPDLNEIQRGLQPFGDLDICTTWFGDTGRVIVSQYHSSGVIFQGGFDHFTRIHGGRINSAVNKVNGVDNPMLIIQQDHGKRGKDMETSALAARL